MGLCMGNADRQGVDLIDVNFDDSPTSLNPIRKKVWSLVKEERRGFPGGPGVENPSRNAGDVGSTPGRGTKIPHASGQLSPCATTGEPKRHN